MAKRATKRKPAAPRVLVGVATFPDEPQIYTETRESIEALGWDEGEFEVRFYSDQQPGMEKNDALTAKHNRMRGDVLDGGFDALLTIEADMIVPPDALGKLYAVDADIVYGLYCSRRSGMWLCFEQIEGFTAAALNADPERAREAWGQVIPSQGAGFGCTLIRRAALENLAFRCDENRRFADDWHFALDAKGAGLRSMSHLGVVCGHIQPDRGIIWPDLEQPELYRWDAVDEPVVQRWQGAVLPPVAEYVARRPIFRPGEDIGRGEIIELDAVTAAALLQVGAIVKKESK